MTVRFPKGKHRARPLYWLRWWPLLVKPKVIRREIMFTKESAYDLRSDDQMDWNKVFGIGYTLSPFGKSARFVERYHIGTAKYQVGAFVHGTGNKKDFDAQQLAELDRYYNYILELWLNDPHEYIFRVIKKQDSKIVGYCAIPKRHKMTIGYLLGAWFGGNKPSPVNRSYQLKKCNYGKTEHYKG